MPLPNNPRLDERTTFYGMSSAVVHPDYTYWARHWSKIRDTEMGSHEVKHHGETYLPRPQGMTDQEYTAYKRRATFYNLVSRTLNALYGKMFMRNPKVNGVDARLRELIQNISKEGTSLHLTAKRTAKEVIGMGRYGILVDADPNGGDPYLAGYRAEDILDWEAESVNGRYTLTRVLLKEAVVDKRANVFSPYSYIITYRNLVLEDGVYRQEVYRVDSTKMPDVDQAPDEVIYPTIRGFTLDYIPFVIFGPLSNTWDVQKPPILDIVELNISHYVSYAELEHGRFYTAMPVYYTVNKNSETKGGYYVGPSVVWEVEETPGILEYQGHGLRFLESALETKEQQIAAIGGRLMPGTSRALSESDNSLKMKEANENTLLLNTSDTIDDGFTKLLRWIADWINVPQQRIQAISFEVNRDYLLNEIGAREIRAIHQMYQDGAIPLDVFFYYLQKATVVPEWMDLAEFGALLKRTEQFPNQVDVLARMKDYPDAKTMHEHLVMQEMQEQQAVQAEPGNNEPQI